jgi:hypothetical protein
MSKQERQQIQNDAKKEKTILEETDRRVKNPDKDKKLSLFDVFFALIAILYPVAVFGYIERLWGGVIGEVSFSALKP